MATYPEGNPGVYPIDPATPVGEFRLLSGESTSEPYDPVEPGFQNYENLSDAEITALIKQGRGSIARGIGFYYLTLAGLAASESKSVQDYDLKLDITKRSGDLRAIADFWLNKADDDDAAAGLNEYFDVVDTGLSHGEVIPELAIPQWGRVYGIERIR